MIRLDCQLVLYEGVADLDRLIEEHDGCFVSADVDGIHEGCLAVGAFMREQFVQVVAIGWCCCRLILLDLKHRCIEQFL